MGNIQLFESKKIRSACNDQDQKWYFVVEDVGAILTGSSDPKQYISECVREIWNLPMGGYK